MSFVFAAITPHPPLLLPNIGKEAIKSVEKTKKSMEKLEEDLYLTHPDAIFIISPHGSMFTDAFTMNVCPEFITDLTEFGDLTTKVKFKGEMTLTAKIREHAKNISLPIAMVSQEKLDHGASVPLCYLTPHLKNIEIAQFGFCDLDWKTHMDFGYMLKEEIMNSNKRIAVIASGDLSHALTADAPACFNEAGKEFDKKIQELFANHSSAGMLQVDPKLIADASECGFRSFLILMGVLKNIDYTYRQYSYEGPFGVGYLVANFII